MKGEICGMVKQVRMYIGVVFVNANHVEREYKNAGI